MGNKKESSMVIDRESPGTGCQAQLTVQTEYTRSAQGLVHRGARLEREVITLSTYKNEINNTDQ